MNDIQDSLSQLDTMMSHGIFDAEVVAADFRTKGWQFVHDPKADSSDENGAPFEGSYFVRTPAGKEGEISWYGEPAIEQLIGNTGYFIQGKAPQRMFLAWIFANQLSAIVLDEPVVDFSVDEGARPLPGEVFRRVVEKFRATDAD